MVQLDQDRLHWKAGLRKDLVQTAGLYHEPLIKKYLNGLGTEDKDFLADVTRGPQQWVKHQG